MALAHLRVAGPADRSAEVLLILLGGAQTWSPDDGEGSHV